MRWKTHSGQSEILNTLYLQHFRRWKRSELEGGGECPGSVHEQDNPLSNPRDSCSLHMCAEPSPADLFIKQIRT